MTNLNNFSLKSINDPEKLFYDKVYLMLWSNPGYLPDPVKEAFRESVVKTAIQICHECGTEQATAEFCAETVRHWLSNDITI